MVSSLRRAVENWARGVPSAAGPLEVIDGLREQISPGWEPAAPDPDLLSLHLPDTDHDGLVEAVVGVDVRQHGEHLTRLRWRRASRTPSSEWGLVDVRADGLWRSEAWCLHPRVVPRGTYPGLTLLPLALSTGHSATGWLAAAQVSVADGALPVPLRWALHATADAVAQAEVAPGQPLVVVQRGAARTTPALTVEVPDPASPGRWRSVSIQVGMAHGHPREGWCDIPDPLPLPRVVPPVAATARPGGYRPA
jgi:hypothetical protein